ncbi:DsbA family protein [Marinobacterium aestuariivivens]|uniref:DsbA family protein n=1 Tax=Marinobacterium aestuariivivens TaxID=1698799 RepID=A0ABW2AAB0_9GAMM
MRKRQKKTKANGPMILMGAALIGVLGIASAGMFYTTKAVSALQAEVTELRVEVSEAAQNQTAPEDFQYAVARSLETLAQKKLKEQIDAKYEEYAAAAEPVPGGKSIYGNVNARFTLVEFSDLECPFCKRFHDTPKQIVDASKGNVNWQWKHLPLSFHNPAANQQALAAECVREQQGNQGFWVFLAEVFKHTRGNGQGVPALVEIIEGVGADVSEVRECMAEGRYNDKIEADTQQAVSHGINGTPATFVIDNTTGKTQLLTGAQPAQAIMAAIRKMMAEQEAQAAAGATGE